MKTDLISKKSVAGFATAFVLVTVPFSALAGLQSIASFSADSTDNSNGYTCTDFSYYSGSPVECYGTEYYIDSDQMLHKVDYESQASAAYGDLKTRTFLSKSAPMPIPEGTEGYLGEDFDPYIVGYGELPEGGYGPEYAFPEVNLYAESYTNASFTDDWLISGGQSGSTGTIVLTYRFDGEITTSYETQPGFIAYSSTDIRLNEIGPISSNAIGIVNQGTWVSVVNDGIYDQVIDLSLDFIFDQMLTVKVDMSSLSVYEQLSGYEQFEQFSNILPAFMTSADFYNTASLNNIRVFDANNELIPFSLESGGGIAQFQGFSNLTAISVPEPTTLALVSIGFLGIGLARRGLERRG